MGDGAWKEGNANIARRHAILQSFSGLLLLPWPSSLPETFMSLIFALRWVSVPQFLAFVTRLLLGKKELERKMLISSSEYPGMNPVLGTASQEQDNCLCRLSIVCLFGRFVLRGSLQKTLKQRHIGSASASASAGQSYKKDNCVFKILILR